MINSEWRLVHVQTNNSSSVLYTHDATVPCYEIVILVLVQYLDWFRRHRRLVPMV